MKLDFRTIKAKVDGDKALPDLEHVFHPLEESRDIAIRCRYMTAGASMRYLTTGSDGRSRFDVEGIFRDHVIGISGLTAEFEDGREVKVDTAEMLLRLPASSMVNRIVITTANHLLDANALTETEEKN